MFENTKQTITCKWEVNGKEYTSEEKSIMIEIALAEYRGLLLDNLTLQEEIRRLNYEIDRLRNEGVSNNGMDKC